MKFWSDHFEFFAYIYIYKIGQDSYDQFWYANLAILGLKNIFLFGCWEKSKKVIGNKSSIKSNKSLLIT